MTDKTTGVTEIGREYSISGGKRDSECYPHNGSHIWGEFAGLAIELGGYSDLTAIDPYTGKRFWLGQALKCDMHAAALHGAKPGPEAMGVYRDSSECRDCCQTPIITGIRRLLDAMEAAGFPDAHRDDQRN